MIQVKSEEELRNLSDQLKENNIHHKLWIEQPENCATCLAVKPYPKNEVKKYFNKFKLLKQFSIYELMRIFQNWFHFHEKF